MRLWVRRAAASPSIDIAPTFAAIGRTEYPPQALSREGIESPPWETFLANEAASNRKRKLYVHACPGETLETSL
jgi:hypothetical protein